MPEPTTTRSVRPPLVRRLNAMGGESGAVPAGLTLVGVVLALIAIALGGWTEGR